MNMTKIKLICGKCGHETGYNICEDEGVNLTDLKPEGDMPKHIEVSEDGKLPDGYWFDEVELQLTTPRKTVRTQKTDRGGFPSSVK